MIRVNALQTYNIYRWKLPGLCFFHFHVIIRGFSIHVQLYDSVRLHGNAIFILYKYSRVDLLCMLTQLIVTWQLQVHSFFAHPSMLP